MFFPNYSSSQLSGKSLNPFSDFIENLPVLYIGNFSFKKLLFVFLVHDFSKEFTVNIVFFKIWFNNK